MQQRARSDVSTCGNNLIEKPVSIMKPSNPTFVSEYIITVNMDANFKGSCPRLPFYDVMVTCLQAPGNVANFISNLGSMKHEEWFHQPERRSTNLQFSVR